MAYELETASVLPAKRIARSDTQKVSDYLRLQEAVAAIAGTVGSTKRGRQWFPHPFPARMPADVATAAISQLTREGHVVLDPMSGSGVVPYCAQCLGRRGVGRDIDPLAVLLGRALCGHVTGRGLQTFCDQVLTSARRRSAGLRTAARYVSKLPDEDRRFLRYWFPERALIQLGALASAISARGHQYAAPVAAAIFSSLIISRGAGASYAMDLSRSRPHKVDTKKPRNPFDIWQEKVAAFVAFYSTKSAPSTPDIALGDARELDVADMSVDAIITSPPYLNAIDYLRTSKFSLVFFGAELEVLREIRASSVGTNVGLAKGVLPSALDDLVSGHVRERRRASLVRRYIYDLYKALREAVRVLRPGGVALYVLGPSILSKKTYDSVEVFARVAEAVGLKMMASARRDLSSTNRSLPPPNRLRRNQSLNRRMTCEYYVVLKKPES